MSRILVTAAAVLSVIAIAGCKDKTAAKTDDAGNAPAAAAAPTETRDGQKDLTALTADDKVRSSTGAYYDTVNIDVGEGTSTITIEMTAFGFLPKLEIMTDKQEKLFEAEALTLNTSNLATASINEKLDPGKYIVVLTSVKPNTLGTYSTKLGEEKQTPLL